MSEPWYDPNMWSWVPGTAVGVAGGLWGSLLGTLAPRGKGKGLIRASYVVLMVSGIALLAAGAYAAATGQPWGIWYGLLLPGIITLAVVGPLGWVAGRAYRHAEERKMRAQEFEG
ncbi:MAG TPA: hypothetical protein VKE40_08010 [Gemmataceae bacterium]|nr:hypothetical protein [Gemmataceae bacterium]